MLGASYISTGNPKKALEVLNELIKSEPQVDYSAYLNRGIAHQQLGHNTEAEADYRCFSTTTQQCCSFTKS
jgi:Tfp pilus assembly protein PilF